MVEKLLALLLLLGCSPIIGSSHLQLQNKAINNREYCRSTLSTKAALSTYDADVEACTNLADITIYMTQWNEEDINRILSKIEYLYNVNLYIEDTTAVKIDLSSLKEMNLVYLVVSHNPTLKEISIPESAFTEILNYKLLLYDNPALDDETLAKFNKYCGNNCGNAKQRDVIVSEHRETMGRVNSSWCEFTTASPELSTYYKPDPEIINCLHFYRVKIYMTGWPVEDVELFTKKFLAASVVTIIVAHSEIEVLDLSALKFTEVFELILLDNLKLKEVRFSDVVMNTRKFLDATAIHSFNNPQLTNQSYETLVKVNFTPPTEPPTTIAPTPPPTEPPTTIAPTPPSTEPPTTIAPTPTPTEPPRAAWNTWPYTHYKNEWPYPHNKNEYPFNLPTPSESEYFDVSPKPENSTGKIIFYDFNQPDPPTTEKLPAMSNGSTEAAIPTTEEVDYDYDAASNAILQLPIGSERMAQSVPPGDIQTQPNAKIVFNAPYDDKHTYHIKVINSSARRIGYGIKTTNMKRLGVDPPCGVLDPKEAVLLAVSCDAFAYGQEDTNNDRITVEWTNTPDGAAKQFRREWFQGDGMVRRKNLPIEYNP
ncbi:unnamed protein product [Caenorhabditis bovis]|nr:unnamed protein product [Caenorhabditis bovis]